MAVRGQVSRQHDSVLSCSPPAQHRVDGKAGAQPPVFCRSHQRAKLCRFLSTRVCVELPPLFSSHCSLASLGSRTPQAEPLFTAKHSGSEGPCQESAEESMATRNCDRQLFKVHVGRGGRSFGTFLRWTAPWECGVCHRRQRQHVQRTARSTHAVEGQRGRVHCTKRPWPCSPGDHPSGRRQQQPRDGIPSQAPQRGLFPCCRTRLAAPAKCPASCC